MSKGRPLLQLITVPQTKSNRKLWSAVFTRSQLWTKDSSPTNSIQMLIKYSLCVRRCVETRVSVSLLEPCLLVEELPSEMATVQKSASLKDLKNVDPISESVMRSTPSVVTLCVASLWRLLARVIEPFRLYNKKRNRISELKSDSSSFTFVAQFSLSP